MITRDEVLAWARRRVEEAPTRKIHDYEKRENVEVPNTAAAELADLIELYQRAMFNDYKANELVDALMDFFHGGCTAWDKMTEDELADEFMSDCVEQGLFEADTLPELIDAINGCF